MPSSQTQLANIALGRFGESRITDYNEQTPAAQVIRDNWDEARTSSLRIHHWNFALKQAELSLLAEVPLFRWTKAYALPADYLRLVDLNCRLSGTTQTFHEVQGQKLLCCESVAKITYVSDVPECQLWDSQFCEFFTYKLASMVCSRLTADAGQVAGQMLRGELQKLLEAMTSNAIETKPPVITALQGSQYLRARCEGDEGYWPWGFGDGLPLQYGVQFNPWNVS